MVDFIAKFVGQDVADGCECAPLVVSLQIFHVFQQENRGFVMRDDLREIKEQGTLRVAKKSVRAAQGILLGDACYRKGLTGEACEKNVMRRYQ